MLSIIIKFIHVHDVHLVSKYNAQFFGATLTYVNKLVWKAWVPPKITFFTWLTNQTRIWASPRDGGTLSIDSPKGFGTRSKGGSGFHPSGLMIGRRNSQSKIGGP